MSQIIKKHKFKPENHILLVFENYIFRYFNKPIDSFNYKQEKCIGERMVLLLLQIQSHVTLLQ